jgi:ATP-dependent Lon protease
MYDIGSVASILQMLKLPDGTVKVLVEGTQRCRIDEIVDDRSHFVARVQVYAAEQEETHEIEAMRRTLMGQFEQYVKLNKKIPPEIDLAVRYRRRGGWRHHAGSSALPSWSRAQQILETFEAKKRLNSWLRSETEIKRPVSRETYPRARRARWKRASASTGPE